MKKTVLLLFLISPFLASSQLTRDDHKEVVADFINNVKTKNPVMLDSLVYYPLSREYPLPAIYNKEEFKQRYNEVFDDELIQKIIKSNPTEDWSAVGWRGIMLDRGDLWIDYDGTLIAVNHQSKWETKKRQELIEAERSQLHPSIQKYYEPIHILKTNKYLIRIDRMVENGKYRYASWPINKRMSDKPDLVILGGEFVSEGSGGNHYYEFKNGAYTYQCYIIIMGEDDSPPANLTVLKGEKEILSQAADIVVK